MRPMLGSMPVLLACLSSCVPDTKPGEGAPSSTYAAAAIYRLDILGLRLGITRNEGCERLRALGFKRQGPDGCGPDPDDLPVRLDDAADQYLGPASGVTEATAGSPAVDFRFLALSYRRIGGRDVVVGINAVTNEPKQEDRIEAGVRARWGAPTHFERHAYRVLRYGSSRAQTDSDARGRFGMCRTFPECQEERGIDCSRVLAKFASAVAEVVIFDWGRHISIDDYRPFLQDLRAARERRPWRHQVCQPTSIH